MVIYAVPVYQIGLDTTSLKLGVIPTDEQSYT